MALLVIFLAGSSARPSLSFLTALDILDPDSKGFLTWLYPLVERRQLRIPEAGGFLTADLYRRGAGGEGGPRDTRPGLLLIHGLAEAGKTDPQLIRFAETMARSGFAVLVPEFPELSSFRVRRSSVRTAVAAYAHLVDDVPGVREGGSGVLGISFGGGIGLLAAADPEIRERVAYVMSFGGYYDLANVIRYYTTGGYVYGEESGTGSPAPWAKWYLILKNLDFLDESEDRVLFERLARQKIHDEATDVRTLADRLTPSGRVYYDLLANPDFGRFPSLYRRLPERVRWLLRDLSPATVIRQVRSGLILAHGVPDPLIPHTETLRLADALLENGEREVTLLRLFHHVEPEGGTDSRGLGFWDRIREGWKFYRLVDRLRSAAGL